MFSYPYHLLYRKRKNLYTSIINNLNSLYSRDDKYEGSYRTGKKILDIKSHVNRIAFEEVITKKINSAANPSEREFFIKAYENSGIIDWRIRQLKYSGIWKRRISADKLGKSYSDKAIACLTLALRDEDEDVRLIAVRALGKLKVESAIEYILSLIKDFSDIRCPNITDILIDYGEKAVPYIEKILGNCDSKTCYWILRALSEMDLKTPSDPGLAAIYISLEETLRNLISNKDEGVRAYSLIPLAKLFKIRKSAIREIGTAEELNSLKELEMISGFLNDKSEIVRINAVTAISIIPDYRASNYLLNALSDDCWEVNYKASRLLIKLFFKYRNEEVKKEVARNLSHPKNIVRKRCREILENIKLIEDYGLDHNEYI
ncbi:MAG: HEAT repeat domain-containing protein [Actinomycetota bacterium]